MKLVCTRELPGNATARLKSHFGDVYVHEGPSPIPRDVLERKVSDCEILLCTLTDRIDRPLLEKAKKLKLLVTYSVGVDHIDAPFLKEKNIPLVHTPGVLSDAVAELTLALILATARRLKPASVFVEEGHFRGADPQAFLGIGLKGSILGVVGLGRIGLAVAEKAHALGMTVLHTPSKQRKFAEGKEAPLAEILSVADVVTLHTPLNPQTKHLIGARELSRMKKTALLINTGRGPLIEETALLAHLRTNPQFFAGLDVYENEPEITPGLAALPNCLCLPHIGSATGGTRTVMANLCVDEAIRFSKGEKLINVWGG